MNIDQMVKKVMIIDQLLNSVTPDELTELVEPFIVINKLKGEEIYDEGPMTAIIKQVDVDRIDILKLQYENRQLKSDVDDLIRLLDKTIFSVTHNQEFQNLKIRSSVY